MPRTPSRRRLRAERFCGVVALVAGATGCDGSLVVVVEGAPRGGGGGHGGGGSTPGVGGSTPGAPCPSGLAFCTDFGNTNTLDEKVLSVSRVTNDVNLGQGNLAAWAPATATACGETRPGLLPGDDVFVCIDATTGRPILADVFNDLGGPAMHGLRIRRPLDFAGRTITVSVDIDAKASFTPSILQRKPAAPL